MIYRVLLEFRFKKGISGKFLKALIFGSIDQTNGHAL
jgi:hypothetical protein